MLDDEIRRVLAGAVTEGLAPIVTTLEQLRQRVGQLEERLLQLRPPESQPEQVYLTVKQAAQRLGVQPRTVRRWIKAGGLRAKRLPSGTLRIPASALSECRASNLDGDG